MLNTDRDSAAQTWTQGSLLDFTNHICTGNYKQPANPYPLDIKTDLLMITQIKKRNLLNIVILQLYSFKNEIHNQMGDKGIMGGYK